MAKTLEDLLRERPVDRATVERHKDLMRAIVEDQVRVEACRPTASDS